VTYKEAVFAVRHLPASTVCEMQQAALQAELYWSRTKVPNESIVVAKAAAVEVILISRGALSVLSPRR